jgi:hypothetical protein
MVLATQGLTPGVDGYSAVQKVITLDGAKAVTKFCSYTKGQPGRRPSVRICSYCRESNNTYFTSSLPRRQKRWSTNHPSRPR